MYIKLFTIIFTGLLMTGNALASNQIKSAMSAAPASVSANAKIIDSKNPTICTLDDQGRLQTVTHCTVGNVLLFNVRKNSLQ